MRSTLFVAALTIGCLLTRIDAIGQNACLPAGPDAQKSIPRPDRALLTPPAKFDCVFKAGERENVRGRSEPSPTSADGLDGTLRTKLDYELQCHRHAEMILRRHLLQLQASTSETIKAIERHAQPAALCHAGTAISLPDRALLAPPAELNCEFKPAAGVSADAAAQMKLDYERQCWRHAEMIARDRLRRLQAALRNTIWAANQNERRAVGQRLPQSNEPTQVAQPRRLEGRDLARALQSGGFVIVHRYTGTTSASWPPATAGTIDTTQRLSPQGRTDAQALGAVYRRLKIPVAQVLSSESFAVYQTATAAFGDGVKLHRDLTGLKAFNDPVELERSVAGFRSRVATRPPPGTNVVLWTHEGKFMKAFGPILAAGDTVVFGPGSDRAPRQVVRLSLKQFLALAHGAGESTAGEWHGQ
jgi:hypothetical protein